MRERAAARVRSPGILLVYYAPLGANAQTVSEHVASFERHSRFPVWSINSELGFPTGLADVAFDVLVLHYSVFGRWPYLLNRTFLDYIRSSERSYKVAFFQDEYQFCQARFRFIEEMKIDCIYTLLDPAETPKVYGKYTSVRTVRPTLTGYVSDDLVEKAAQWTKPDAQRRIDVGYRARPLPYFMGRGAQEKTEIARRFVELAGASGLALDVKTAEADRIYGEDWWRFIADCRGMLGVEAGVSIFDLEDVVQRRCAQLLSAQPDLTFGQVSALALEEWEDRIYYRTISPRVFEAAAFRVCQILFEGRYNGLLEPMRHYIPLRKDFSNFSEVMAAFRDPALRQRIAEQAYEDLIASGVYSYARFIDGFDQHLLSAGVSPFVDAQAKARVERALDKGRRTREFIAAVRTRLHRPFPGKRLLKGLAAPVLGLRRRPQL